MMKYYEMLEEMIADYRKELEALSAPELAQHYAWLKSGVAERVAEKVAKKVIDDQKNPDNYNLEL